MKFLPLSRNESAADSDTKANADADDDANAKAFAWPQLNRQFCTQIHLIWR